MRVLVLGSILLCLEAVRFAGVAAAQQGWAHQRGFTIKNTTGAPLEGHQVAIPIDTAMLLAAEELDSNGADLRVGTNCTSTTFLPHWIEKMNSANSQVWVRATLPTGDTPLYVHWGNPDAADSSDASAVFDGSESSEPFSATQRLMTGLASANPLPQPTSQRGFRFSPNEDVVLVKLGRREPKGSERYVTLFDFGSKAKLLQARVAGDLGVYSYQDVPPIMLRSGTHYVVTVFQSETDQYYYGSSSQIDPHLTYGEMRYCLACDKDTFPGSSLSNAHYGYADFLFLVRAAATPQPESSPGVVETADCDADGSLARCGDGTLNGSAGEECDDGNAVETDACRVGCVAARCGDGLVQTGVEDCDDTNTEETDACRNDCKAARCGDGVLRAGVETCDDGNDNNADDCPGSCQPAVCGDGYVLDDIEDCDDGNDVDTDACSNSCVAAKCGDGAQQDGEECDDGNDDDTDECPSSCKPAACGDGFVRSEVEACDDENTVSGDGCSEVCVLELAGESDDDAGVDERRPPAADGGRIGIGGLAGRGGTTIDPGPDERGADCTCRVGPGRRGSDAGALAWIVAAALAWGWRRRAGGRAGTREG